MNDLVQANEDRELVERARQRDVAAFEELVARYRSKVYGLAVRMMQDPSDAEEVMQESFLSAWQNLPSFRGESAFGSWLYRICANFCLMRLRRKKVETTEAEAQLPEPRFDSEGSLLSHPSYDWSRGTEEKALDNELRVAIETATDSLPAEHRTVFLLKDIEGLSYEEIAETLGTTVPAVKSRLHRARLALREAIDAFYKQPESPARSPRPAPLQPG
ncbi:MAG: sigma-70 family RNA polymerase sigma factor [Deltaproteobacteria bacterium]|nr:sigma-70 family RNA polymerase sigma factor [Deltaproteobacteria bacterium]